MIDIKDYHFAFLELEEAGHVLTVRLAREKRKNALHPHMLVEIAFALQYAQENADIWMVLMEAKGNVFCAGGDLKAMAGIIEPHDSTVPKPKKAILFHEIFSSLHKPLIAKVAGDVYAGGFMILASATIVVAADHLKFGLSEVKRGIFPFQVMAALLEVMPARKVLDWCVRGYNLPVAEAQKLGLVTEICPAENLDQQVQDIIKELKNNSPRAMSLGLEAYRHIRPTKEEHQYLSMMLMKAIQSEDGREGLAAFREKRKPNWTGN